MLLAAGSLIGAPAAAMEMVEIFRCVDAAGVVSFQDTPCEPTAVQSLQRLDASESGIRGAAPRPIADPSGSPQGRSTAATRPDGLQKTCSQLDIVSFSPRGVSLEFTTAAELDGFWGEQRRGFLERPMITTEQFSLDINDVAICADIVFRLKAFNGRLNKGNNLGREMRAHFVARSSQGRVAPAMSGTFPDGSIRLGAPVYGTYCFWRGSEGGVLEDVGCR